MHSSPSPIKQVIPVTDEIIQQSALFFYENVDQSVMIGRFNVLKNSSEFKNI